jgi:glyoxylase-like metal-dependent hydrolase (beta-lactamase superfamily II)
MQYIPHPRFRRLLDHLYSFEDTCTVYVVRSGNEAVLIDFGSGDVLDHLDTIGIERVTDVLITHHHRDQCQGLPRALKAKIQIWVPHVEQDLFRDADAHWQAREIANNYNMRQDRFSLLKSVEISGTLEDYEVQQFGDYDFTVVPTPGHTIGSVSLMAKIDDTQVAFTGDLIAAPGQVWSLAATQWTYNGAEGAPATIASLLDLRERQPDMLLPSHGEVMNEPAKAIDMLADRLWQLLQLRNENLNLFDLREQPYEEITPHLLRHRASMANTYVLVSESKKALMIDFGYDFMTGFSSGSDRASRRPWLYTIPTLKKQFGIEHIDVVLSTHFHDDHVAGINLLRRVEKTQHWAAESYADILEDPVSYDLPCLWYDPIPVDCRLPLEKPIQWEEYTLTLYPLPGHTRYAVAISFEVDGKRILATGDQYQGGEGLKLNYVYYNRFQATDYIQSAVLYDYVKPDIILTGHWKPLYVGSGYFNKLATLGLELEWLHQEMLTHTFDLGESGFLAQLYPYQIEARNGEPFTVRVDLRNPFRKSVDAVIQMVVPESWQIVSAKFGDDDIGIDAHGAVFMTFENPEVDVPPLTFTLIPYSSFSTRRVRIAVDTTINGQRFGQQAEALVNLR